MNVDSRPSWRQHAPSPDTGYVVGRYAVYSEFAAGGMATVHFGRLLGAAGFARTVAIKRLHAPFAHDPDFVAMLVDEARLAARIRHPNVVQTLDVVQSDGETFLVLDYVHGDSLAGLLKKAQANGERVPLGVAIAVLRDALHGLDAAHEAKSEQGDALEIVHRDMSPHNVLVGVDGGARVLDFGIAKAGGRAQITRDGQVKGKLSYLAPEQLTSEHAVDRRADVYAAAATLWELVTGQRLVRGESDWQRVTQICAGDLAAPSTIDARVPSALDAIVMKGLAKRPDDRFPSAGAMAEALEGLGLSATPREVGAWVEAIGGDALRERAARVAAIERCSASEGPRLLAEEPTMTRSGAAAILVAEASATGSSPRAAMARAVPASAMDAASLAIRPSAPAFDASDAFERPRTRSRRGALALLLLFVACAASAASIYAMRRDRVVALSAPLPSTPPAAPVASIVTAASVPVVAAPPSASPAAPSRPDAPGAPRAAWKRPAAGASPSTSFSTSPAAPARAEASECDVPYTIDADGFRHPKAQCL